MDDLEKSAAAHTKYERTKADWLQIMVDLLQKATPWPVYQRDRFKLYHEAKVPASLIQELDRRAFEQAMHKFEKTWTDL